MLLASHLRKELRNSLLRTATNKSNMTEGEREIGIENLMIYEPIYKHLNTFWSLYRLGIRTVYAQKLKY